jgi:hypothetical protein
MARRRANAQLQPPSVGRERGHRAHGYSENRRVDVDFPVEVAGKNDPHSAYPK